MPVSEGQRFTSISAAGNTTCALTPQGSAYCWGANSSGTSGSGSTNASNTPVPVSGDLRFSSITVGGLGHAGGLTAGGSAHCWGMNRHGQLGTGNTVSHTTPVALSGGFSFQSISAGLSHTCGLASGGAAYCWGWDRLRQIDGAPSQGDVLAPVRVASDLSFTSLKAGAVLTCGIAGANSYCRGATHFGQKGNGTTSSSRTTKLRLPATIASPLYSRVWKTASFHPYRLDFRRHGVLLGSEYRWAARNRRFARRYLRSRLNRDVRLHEHSRSDTGWADFRSCDAGRPACLRNHAGSTCVLLGVEYGGTARRWFNGAAEHSRGCSGRDPIPVNRRGGLPT